jgi:hypothetical protein
MVASGVSTVFFACGPFNIARLVAFVVIHAVDLHTSRSHTYLSLDVFYELSYIVPRIANKNATTTVVLVLLCSRYVAPVHHSPPYAVKHVFPQSMPA